MQEMEVSTADDARESSRILSVVGVVISGVWVACVSIYILRSWPKVTQLEPNALGDFLAGASAPLAFLWLVLGFFQQGQELRHSSEALWLQGRELQNSVEQQRELVNVTREQLRLESDMIAQQREEIARISRPILELSSGGSTPHLGDRRSYELYLTNHGRPCTKIVIYRDNEISITNADILQTGSRKKFDMLFRPDAVETFNLTATYVDDRLVHGSTTWRVCFENQSFTFSGVVEL